MREEQGMSQAEIDAREDETRNSALDVLESYREWNGSGWLVLLWSPWLRQWMKVAQVWDPTALMAFKRGGEWQMGDFNWAVLTTSDPGAGFRTDVYEASEWYGIDRMDDIDVADGDVVANEVTNDMGDAEDQQANAWIYNADVIGTWQSHRGRKIVVYADDGLVGIELYESLGNEWVQVGGKSTLTSMTVHLGEIRRLIRMLEAAERHAQKMREIRSSQ